MKVYVYSYSTDNLGDEVQSIAASRIVPAIDGYVERDRTSLAYGERDPILLIANGWYMHNPRDFPPPAPITPFYISVHFTEGMRLDPHVVEHLRAHGPVGCRDVVTLKALQAANVEAYFSGCLTTTLEFPKNVTARNDETLLVDVLPETLAHLPADIRASSRALTPITGEEGLEAIREERTVLSRLRKLPRPVSDLLQRRIYRPWLEKRSAKQASPAIIAKRFKDAAALLEQFAAAKLVITSRLHCALPCVAMGTPVIFIHRNPNDPRFGAIAPYLKIYGIPDLATVNWKPETVGRDVLRPHQEFLRKAVRSAAETGENPFRGQRGSQLIADLRQQSHAVDVSLSKTT